MPESRDALRELYASKTRTLDEAACDAWKIAQAEHLPIAATLADGESWHRKAILKTIPVYGHQGAQPPVASDCGNDLSGATLTVKSADFRRYLDWLHTVW